MTDKVTYRFFNSENLLLCQHYVTFQNQKPKSYEKIKGEHVNELMEVTFSSLI